MAMENLGDVISAGTNGADIPEVNMSEQAVGEKRDVSVSLVNKVAHQDHQRRKDPEPHSMRILEGILDLFLCILRSYLC